MAKIRVKDLASKLKLPEQDLLFKLKSIGLRVDSVEAEIESEALQAVMKGKDLPRQPREVILRDEATPAPPPRPTRRPTPLPRRPAPNPLRPGRARTMINRVDTQIQTLPSSKRPAAESPEPVEAAASVETQAPAMAPTAAAEAATSPAESTAASPPASAPEGTETPVPAKTKTLSRSRVATPAAPVSTGGGVARPKKVDRSSLRPGPSGRRPARRPGRPGRGGDNTPRPFRSTTSNAPPGPPGGTSERSKRRGERSRPGDGGLVFAEGKPEGPVMIAEGMTVREFAEKLGVKNKDLIKALVSRGVLATINHILEAETAEALAEEFGVETMVVTFEEEVAFQQEAESEDDSFESLPRGPVVTIMGHVDHGKTTLLDTIRSSRVTASEHGGITQHIGAYQVERGGQKIVFLDTPGHEAFTLMRARGAQATDIVVLVVAADDGVMPQTEEAINHAKAANVPLIVAINKIDKDNANADRVKKELSERELLVEDWGGDTVSVDMSALKGEGVDELLEMIHLQAELLELKAPVDVPAQGLVLEARKDPGRGIVATVLVQRGQLSTSDSFVSGATWGRVRSMTNDLGERLDGAGPSTPLEITGFQEVPEAGDPFQVLEDESKARSIAEYRQNEDRQRSLAPNQGAVSLEQLFSQIEEGEVKELPVVLKGDVQGSVEVLKDALQKVSTDQVKVKVIASGVGGISTNDVILATASDAIIIGFNVRPEKKATELAEKEQIDIRLHTVIYELLDELKLAMVGLLDPTFKEVVTGRAEVREIFKVPKAGSVAGCHVVEGLIKRSNEARLLRDNVVVYEGNIASLRRFKDDASEVRTGFDCGIGLERFQDAKPGDIIEGFEQEELERTL